MGSCLPDCTKSNLNLPMGVYVLFLGAILRHLDPPVDFFSFFQNTPLSLCFPEGQCVSVLLARRCRIKYYCSGPPASCIKPKGCAASTKELGAALQASVQGLP